MGIVFVSQYRQDNSKSYPCVVSKTVCAEKVSHAFMLSILPWKHHLISIGAAHKAIKYVLEQMCYIVKLVFQMADKKSDHICVVWETYVSIIWENSSLN